MADNTNAPTRQEIDQAEAIIRSYGLESLWAGVSDFLSRGYKDVSQILFLVSNDPQYQEAFYARFPGIRKIREENQRRTAAGQPAIYELSPAEYVADEQAYAEATRGLGSDLTSRENIAEWIAGGVSPTEVKERIDIARDYIEYNVNPAVRAELRDIYGLTDSEMVDYVLGDPRRREQLTSEFEQRQRQANTRAAAKTQGLNISRGLLDEVASSSDQVGSFGNASAIFSNVADQADAYARLGAISGIATSTDDLVREQFNLEGGTNTTKRKRRLSSQERARFNRTSAIGGTSLAAGGLGTQ